MTFRRAPRAPSAIGEPDPRGDRAGAGPVLPRTTAQLARRGGAPAADPLTIAAAGVAGPGAPLPHGDVVQRAFGPDHDLSTVRAHVGGAAGDAADALGAHGYATGDDVAFAAPPSLFLVAHEAAHVVQQRGGVQLSSAIGAAGDRFETHADAVAEAVVAGRSAAPLLAGLGTGGAAAGSVQRKPAEAGTWADLMNNLGVKANDPRAFAAATLRERISMLERADAGLAAEMLATVSKFEVRKLLENTIVRIPRPLQFKVIEARPEVVPMLADKFVVELVTGGGRVAEVGKHLSDAQIQRLANGLDEPGKLAPLLRHADAHRLRVAFDNLFFREEARLIVDLDRWGARALAGALRGKSPERWRRLIDAAHEESGDLGVELTTTLRRLGLDAPVDAWERG
jgi:hypothetical protein